MADNIEDDSPKEQPHKHQMSQATLRQKQKRQQRNRRGNTLFKKACELSILADADVFLGIRFRDGRIKTFCADKTSFWSSTMSHLDSYYPLPQRKTPRDFVSKKMEKSTANQRPE